jgi:hypothetical protein
LQRDVPSNFRAIKREQVKLPTWTWNCKEESKAQQLSVNSFIHEEHMPKAANKSLCTPSKAGAGQDEGKLFAPAAGFGGFGASAVAPA